MTTTPPSLGEQPSTPLVRLRAFILSNSIAIVSALPSLALPASAVYLSTLSRMGIVVGLLTVLARGRKRPATWRELARCALVAAPIETAVVFWALKRVSPQQAWWKFVPMSFCFELAFDWFHYWTHRLEHAHSWLYQVSGHKTHHQAASPVPLDTFCQDPMDVVLTNALPMVAALLLLDKVAGFSFSREQLLILLGYKTYIEVAGHVGDNYSKATSFPQFVYLPRWLGIELRTRDHDLHHTRGGRSNFGKRFTAFDRLFGTYEEQ